VDVDVVVAALQAGQVHAAVQQQVQRQAMVVAAGGRSQQRMRRPVSGRGLSRRGSGAGRLPAGREGQRQAEAELAVAVVDLRQKADRDPHRRARRDVGEPGLELVDPLLFHQRGEPALGPRLLVLSARLGFFADLALDHAVIRLDAQAVDGRSRWQREAVDGFPPARPVVPEHLGHLHAGRQPGHLDDHVCVQGDAAGRAARRHGLDPPEGTRHGRLAGVCARGFDTQNQQQQQGGGQDEQDSVLPGQRGPPPWRTLIRVALRKLWMIAPDGLFQPVANRDVSGHGAAPLWLPGQAHDLAGIH
jgi:hypothetical protein